MDSGVSRTDTSTEIMRIRTEIDSALGEHELIARDAIDVQALRRLRDDILADRHQWVKSKRGIMMVPCPASPANWAAEDGADCLCGRDKRVERRLRLLAQVCGIRVALSAGSEARCYPVPVPVTEGKGCWRCDIHHATDWTCICDRDCGHTLCAEARCAHGGERWHCQSGICRPIDTMETK